MDEIMIDTAGQAYFTARGEPAWHELGTVFQKDERVSLVEAGQRIGADFHTEMFPTYMKVGETYILVPKHVTIARPPLGDETEYQPLQVVGKNYKQIANDNLFDMFNELSEVFPVETIGVLGDGERVFVALDAGWVDIKGDVVHQYLTIYDEKSGRSATKVILTPVRIVCANTLRWGLKEATLTLNVAHVRNNEVRLERIAKIALELQKRLDLSRQLFSSMADAPFSLSEFRWAVSQIYKLPPAPVPDETVVIDVSADYEKLREVQLAHQMAALELFQKFNDEQPRLARTQWAAWQAVTELEDWKKGRGKGRYTSALFGQRAETKMDAFAIINGVVQPEIPELLK